MPGPSPDRASARRSSYCIAPGIRTCCGPRQYRALRLDRVEGPKSPTLQRGMNCIAKLRLMVPMRVKKHRGFPSTGIAVTLPPIVQPKSKNISFGPSHFLNRELSWLEFNQRVLEEALDPKTPLLERLKFFCIGSSNLDEFFEVRVAGVKQQIESEVVERTVDGLTATETFRAIVKRVRRMVEQQYSCWRQELRERSRSRAFGRFPL